MVVVVEADAEKMVGASTRTVMIVVVTINTSTAPLAALTSDPIVPRCSGVGFEPRAP
jgi:hypothetical protein